MRSVRRQAARAAATMTAILVAVSTASRPAAAQRSDTTVATRNDARIAVVNFTGSVTVKAWSRPAVRVVASHSRQDAIRVRGGEGSIRIESTGRHGRPGMSVDYEIRVPTGASLDIGGTYTDIDIDGVRGPVSASTVRGEVRLRGGDGIVSLKSVEGAVVISDARGKIELNGVNKGLTLRNVRGDIIAETVNGSIEMDSIVSSEVDAVTVNGRITYAGTISDRGRYSFGTHNGSIVLAIPAGANATVSAITYQGRFSSQFPVSRPQQDGSPSTGRRIDVTLGTGSARVNVESFQGTIVLRKQ